MKTGALWIVLTLIGQTIFAQNKDIEILKTLNRDWINSYPTKDTVTLDKIFAPDFVLISPKGIKMTKRDIINNLHKQETVSAIVDSVDVRLLTSDVGVVTACASFVLKTEGKEMSAQNCYQDIYMKRKGKWVAVAAHVTLLSFK
jgi:uncharacterized protein (TIGR02246 family)